MKTALGIMEPHSSSPQASTRSSSKRSKILGAMRRFGSKSRHVNDGVKSAVDS